MSLVALCAGLCAQELLGGLWAYVRVTPPSEVEQLSLLAAAHPPVTPLLPAAVATLHLVQLAAGHVAPPQAQTHAAARSARGGGGAAQPGAAPAGDAQQAAPPEEQAWWVAAAAAALRDAGVRPGELSLSLPRHFSVRDLFKWARRMQALHGAALGARALQPLAAAVDSLLAAAAADEPPRSPSQQQRHKRRGRAAGGAAASVALWGYELGRAEQGVREAAFGEAADLFAALVARPEARRRLLRALATLWALPADAAVEG